MSKPEHTNFSKLEVQIMALFSPISSIPTIFCLQFAYLPSYRWQPWCCDRNVTLGKFHTQKDPGWERSCPCYWEIVMWPLSLGMTCEHQIVLLCLIVQVNICSLILLSRNMDILCWVFLCILPYHSQMVEIFVRCAWIKGFFVNRSLIYWWKFWKRLDTVFVLCLPLNFRKTLNHSSFC
jgi:hypothetical protein